MNKFQYSKLLPIFTGIIFVATLIMGYVSTFTSVVDVSFFITTVTISGSVWGTTILWYLKKSQTENTFKLRIALYKEATQERLKYNEKMLRLQWEFGLTKEDIHELDDDTDIDEMVSSALSGATNVLDNADSESENIELQQY